ncbi:hypothetical protein [Sulfurovum sp.]|uniref:hypothetical protein n=1 Tax=Sulfurovum sp. TaxID=1969726 RepID=UPI0025D4B99F|nr:hypothetical protein [Sulfurovum sp.]
MILPLIYLRSIIDEPKPIRTIFIDITATEKKEAYRLFDKIGFITYNIGIKNYI